MSQALLEQVAAWGAGIIALATSIAVLVRRLSRDRTEMTKDRVESTFVETLQTERDEAIATARDAQRERQIAGEAIARLAAHNEFLRRENLRLQREFASYKRLMAKLFPDSQQFLATDWQQTTPPPPEPPA